MTENEKRLLDGLTPDEQKWWYDLPPVTHDQFVKDMETGHTKVGTLRRCVKRWSEEDADSGLR